MDRIISNGEKPIIQNRFNISKFMGKYSKKSESTGCQSIIDAEREFKKYSKILETVMNEQEFEQIWKVVPASLKLHFIQNSLKYVFKEKGRETEADTKSMNGKLDEVDKKMQALTKLLNS
jgi:hypothetical protein